MPALVGVGDERTTLVVQEFRLPGVALGVLACAAIGVAGALVLEPGGRVTLAAPFAVVLLVLVWPAGGAALAIVAVLTVAGAVALRQPAGLGLVALVVIGAVLGLVVGGDGPQPGRWLESGLEHRGWSWVLPFAVAVAVLIPLALARGVVAATGLAALAVATVGSIALVALPAALLGRRGAAALAGVALVLTGDLLAGAGVPVAALALGAVVATALGWWLVDRRRAQA